MDENVSDLCVALSNEPMFHLSLHSKELFHSNFLAWLCEKHPSIAGEVFSAWVPERGGQSTIRVQREADHLDLAIELPGLAPFVVENKVFAPPDEAQLDRYASGRMGGLDQPSALLLSLSPPFWDGDTYLSPNGQQWRHVSYSQLAGALEVASSGIGGFDGELIRHYSAFAETLARLADVAGFVGPDEAIAVDESMGLMLRGIRLFDGISKLRARVAIAAARKSLDPELAERIRWEAGFSNAHPLNAAFLDRDDGDWLGWQYQGDQWRVVAITDRHKGRTDKERDARHIYVAQHYASWFDFTPIERLTGRPIDVVPPTEARDEFNGYNPDFVYRYRKLPQLTLGELVALSDHYLNAASIFELDQ
jgi:hypothetical protein